MNEIDHRCVLLPSQNSRRNYNAFRKNTVSEQFQIAQKMSTLNK